MKTVKFEARELVTTLTILNKMNSGYFPVSKMAFFKIRNGVAEILGLNENVKISARLYVDGDDCEIVVDKKDMLDIVKGASKGGGSIIFEVDEDNVTVRSNVGAFLLKLSECDEMPTCDPSNIHMEQFSTKNLAEALDSVVYAAPKDDTRASAIPVVHIVDGRVLYGCDNYRLARYETKESYITFPEHVCIPTGAAKFVVDVLNTLGEKSGLIGIEKDRMVIEVSKYRIGVTRKDCLLPAFESILAKEYKTVVFVNPRLLFNALKQARKIKKVKYVYIEVSSSKADIMKLSFHDNEGNPVTSMEIPVTPKEVEGFDKAFNIQYLIDALKPTKETIALCCPGKDNNWIDICDGEYRAMIMETIRS
jgi:DNA polymerase III sliding clamp (beta) subunit (PCNA family)